MQGYTECKQKKPTLELNTEYKMTTLDSVCQREQAKRAKAEQERIELHVRLSAQSLKAVTPRWVAKAMGMNLGDVIACFKRQTALGRLEQINIEGSDEIYYRQK